MVCKATKRKILEVWHDECAICGSKDFLEFHHIIPKEGTEKVDSTAYV